MTKETKNKRLCLLCRKRLEIGEFKKHLEECENKFKKEHNLK